MLKQIASVGCGILIISLASQASAGTVQAGQHIYNTAVDTADFNKHLSVSQGGLVGHGEWNNTTDNPIIEWNITASSGGNYTYVYTFGDYNAGLGTIGDLGKTLSHMLLEVSTSVTSIPGLSIDDFTPSTGGASHPGLPGNIHAIDTGTGAKYSFSFTLARAPVWGNFYAKDGNNGVGQWTYNHGFGSSPQQITTADYFIARPDTISTVVPLPSAAAAGMVLCSALGMAQLTRSHRRRDDDLPAE